MTADAFRILYLCRRCGLTEAQAEILAALAWGCPQ